MKFRFHYILFLLIIILFVCAFYDFIVNPIEIFEDGSDSVSGFKNIPMEWLAVSGGVGGGGHIPKIIHHIAQSDRSKWHATWSGCLDTWYTYFPEPEYKHMMWHDEDFDGFVDREFPWFLDTFRKYDKHIKRVDMMRPFILYKYGGIYADMDFMTFRNFYDELPGDRVSIVESPFKENEFLQNSLIASPPGNPYWLFVMDSAYDSSDRDVLAATGPVLLSNVYFNHKDMVNILPVNRFNPDNRDANEFNRTDIVTKHLSTTTWGNK
jgi:inositol phosphorylceramide mannosyltransferase catalytic subunit